MRGNHVKATKIDGKVWGYLIQNCDSQPKDCIHLCGSESKLGEGSCVDPRIHGTSKDCISISVKRGKQGM